MKLGNKIGKVSTMGNKVQLMSTLGNKVLNAKPNGAVRNPNSGQSMHHTLVNNIANSAHSVFIPTGINQRATKPYKSNLEKH